jgi:hypothetical protein
MNKRHNHIKVSNTTGQSLGGARGGNLDTEEIPTPESLARDLKGGTMKVMISSPSGDRVLEIKGGHPAMPIGGDSSKATGDGNPIGGTKGGQ